MQVRSARPKFLSMAAVSARHTVRARQRQRGTGRKAAGISIPRRSRRFPFNHQNRTRAPTSLYKCTWRGVASIRAPAAAGGRGACRWSCLRCGARRPTPVAHPFLAPARSFGSGAAADVADSRLCAAEAGRWRPGRTGGSRADAAASGARALRGGCRAPGRDREDGRGGAGRCTLESSAP